MSEGAFADEVDRNRIPKLAYKMKKVPTATPISVHIPTQSDMSRLHRLRSCSFFLGTTATGSSNGLLPPSDEPKEFVGSPPLNVLSATAVLLKNLGIMVLNGGARCSFRQKGLTRKHQRREKKVKRKSVESRSKTVLWARAR